MTDADNVDRQQIIDGFVERLVRMRADAGDPSFRSMAKRSGAISHATLHDAVQGTRLPSWETTAEFAKACGVEPATVRADWESASASLCPELEAPKDPDATVESADSGGPDEATGVRTPAAAKDHFSGGPSRSAIAFGVGGLILGLVIGFFVLNLQDRDDSPSAAATTPAAKRTSGSGATATPSRTCRKNRNTHLATSARTSGDGADFDKDLTMQDCTTVPAGKTMTKTWRYINDGDVTWKGRFLRRIDPYLGAHDCKTAVDVPIPTTKPGESVDISTKVETPEEPTYCYVRFMMVDEDGDYAFPGQRPVFFSVAVR